MKCRKWLELAGQILLMAVGFALVYCLLMWTSGDGDGITVLSLLPYYMVMGCGLFVMVMGITAYITYLPVCISFGCTRRDAVIGLQIMSRLPAMGVILLAFAVSFAVRNDITRGFMAAWLPLFFLLIAVGSIGGIVGSLGIRFGRIGRLLSVCIFVLCGMVGGFVGGFTAGGGMGTEFIFDISGMLTLIAGAVALVLWAVELILVIRIMKNYEVKL